MNKEGSKHYCQVQRSAIVNVGFKMLKPRVCTFTLSGNLMTHTGKSHDVLCNKKLRYFLLVTRN